MHLANRIKKLERTAAIKGPRAGTACPACGRVIPLVRPKPVFAVTFDAPGEPQAPDDYCKRCDQGNRTFRVEFDRAG